MSACVIRCRVEEDRRLTGVPLRFAADRLFILHPFQYPHGVGRTTHAMCAGIDQMGCRALRDERMREERWTIGAQVTVPGNAWCEARGSAYAFA